jgi:hypothetical protein
MLVTVAIAQADDPTPLPATGQCSQCHPQFVKDWQTGAHGQAASDPVFKADWEAKGSPPECLACHTTGYNAATSQYLAEGVTCAACHPATPDHPTNPMPVNTAATTCGACHTNTLLEWQVSQHGSHDLDCATCHDPHGTALKTGSPSTLCATCHKERDAEFAHSVHQTNNVSCADCHLAPTNETAGEGRALRDHSFNAQLAACQQCHTDEMHQASQAVTAMPTPAPLDAMASVESMGVSAAPEPVSPLGFATLAGVLGFGVGIVLYPWIDQWYRGNKTR